MARDFSPITKQSRREGTALHNKAHKIMVKRAGGPGQHGDDRRRRKPSQYAVQLREKQKVKRLYGVLERQFANLMGEANKATGKSGDVLLQLLERRLDNALYRAGIAPSRRAARQLVNHGHFSVNERRVSIPSYRLKPGDKISLRPRSMSRPYFAQFDASSAADQPPLTWLKSNVKKFEVQITGLPTRDEAEANINENLIVEYYSR